jgi:hypothetical protein
MARWFEISRRQERSAALRNAVNYTARARGDGKHRKHVPDHLLITDDGPVVVDVKTLRHLAKPVVVQTFAWTRAAVEVLARVAVRRMY